MCFRTPEYYYLNLGSVRPGTIFYSQGNLLIPVSIQRSQALLLNLLQQSGTPQQDLNRQFIALQLSFRFYGGTGSPVIVNVLWSTLRCSGVIFQPVMLSNGVTITPDSVINTLYQETFSAISQNRVSDMTKLAQIMALLNTRC
ncbi:MAG: hypothetical protein IPL01_05260 [Acidobacteria bacterium]|nr:hypothetical protein [Acidobacteriota bacterium]MBK8313466.1 hypothetical protein [Acidobacteriota bacterium]